MTVEFQGYHINIRLKDNEVEDSDDLFNDLPKSADILSALENLFESSYQIDVHDDGFSDFALGDGKL